MTKEIILFFFYTIISMGLYAQGQNMTLEATWDGSGGTPYNDVWGYVDDAGSEYAIFGSQTHVYFINVSDPSNPVLVDGFDGSWTNPDGSTINGANTVWRDMKTYKHFAYAVADNSGEGLMIFSLCDLPNSVTKVNQDNTVFGSAHNVYIDVPNGRMYVVGANTRSQGLIIYDVAANPVDPPVIGNVNIDGGYVHDIFVQNNIAYCSSGNDGMYILDCTDPTDPCLVASLNTGGYNHSAWIYEDGTKLLYAEEVPTGLPMGILDISNMGTCNFPGSIDMISTFRAPLEAPAATNVTYHNPYIVDNYAIVSSYQDGVTMYDISDPNNVTRVAYYDTFLGNNGSYSGYQGCWGTYPFLPSGIILGADRSTGLYILSTTIPITSECGNGVQDAFERGVDCGGFCQPCNTGCADEVSCILNNDFPNMIPNGVHEVENLITSDGTVGAGTDVNFKANCIELNEGFEVQLNSQFLGEIDPCIGIQ